MFQQGNTSHSLAHTLRLSTYWASMMTAPTYRLHVQPPQRTSWEL